MCALAETEVSDDGVDIAVEISFATVFQFTERANEHGTLVFSGHDRFERDALMSRGILFEEVDDLGGVNEPLVPVDGFLLGKVVMGDGATSFFDGAARATPAVRQGDKDILSGNAEEVTENAVKGIEVFQDFKAAGGVVALVFDRKLLDLLQVANQIGVAHDIDSKIFGIGNESTKWGFVAPDIKNRGAELFGKVGKDEAGAVLTFREFFLVDGGSHHDV